jgi:hypothetical protein
VLPHRFGHFGSACLVMFHSRAFCAQFACHFGSACFVLCPTTGRFARVVERRFEKILHWSRWGVAMLVYAEENPVNKP